MREIKAYACDFCKKFTKTKQSMKKHEALCFHNPIAKACASCEHYIQEEHKVEINGIPAYQSRPSCTKGKSLFNLDSNNPQGYKVTLKNNCELWKERQ